MTVINRSEDHLDADDQDPAESFMPDDPNSPAYVAAAGQAERERESLEKRPQAYRKRMAKYRARSLHHRDLEASHLGLAARLALEIQDVKKAWDATTKRMDGPIRVVPTMVTVGVCIIAAIVGWWIDAGAIEAIGRTSVLASRFIALAPALVEAGTSHLYGKAKKRQDLALDPTMAGRNLPRFSRWLILGGLAHAGLVGVIRGIFTGLVAAVFFAMLAILIWVVIAVVTYFWESPHESRFNQLTRRWKRGLKRARRARDRKRSTYGKRFIPARELTQAAAGGLVERVRVIFRTHYLHHEEELPTPLAGPAWLSTYRNWAQGKFGALDLSETQLEADVPDSLPQASEMPPELPPPAAA